MLNATTLGGAVVGSSLTSTGALNGGSITSGFGAIDNGTSLIRTSTFTAETAYSPDASGGADLGTTALEFNDIFLNDGGVIQLGDDQDVTITHVADVGITLNLDMTITGADLTLAAAGVKLTGSDGDITFLGLGDGFDEDFTINIDDTENTGVWTSSTALNKMDFGAIGIELNQDVNLTLGAQTIDHDGTDFVFNDTINASGLTITTDLSVANGGTGASTFTDGGILLGSGTNAFTALGAATNGQIPIGDGTTDPQLATITGGENITITNGSASITVDVDEDTLIIFRPQQNEPPTSNFATLDLKNVHPVLDFDATADESSVFSGIMPQRYDGGGTSVCIHSAMTSATSGTLQWDVAWERIGDDVLDIDSDSFAAVNNSGDITVPGTAGNVAIDCVTFTDGADMDSVAVGEGFRIKATRTTPSAGATGDAELRFIEVKEQ